MVVRAPPPGFRGAEQAPLAPFDDPATRRSRWALGVRLLRSLGAVLRAAPGVCECGDTADLGGRLVDGSCATSCLLLSGTRAQPSASVSSGSGLWSSARTLDEYCSSHPSRVASGCRRLQAGGVAPVRSPVPWTPAPAPAPCLIAPPHSCADGARTAAGRRFAWAGGSSRTWGEVPRVPRVPRVSGLPRGPHLGRSTLRQRDDVVICMRLLGLG